MLPRTERSSQFTLLTVVGVTLLSTVAMIVYPLVVRLAGFDAGAAGIFLGGTIHDVAQVVEQLPVEPLGVGDGAEVALERATARGSEAVLGPRNAPVEPLRADDVRGLLELAGVHAQVAVARLEQRFELVEREALAHGEGAHDREPHALVNLYRRAPRSTITTFSYPAFDFYRQHGARLTSGMARRSVRARSNSASDRA